MTSLQSVVRTDTVVFNATTVPYGVRRRYTVIRGVPVDCDAVTMENGNTFWGKTVVAGWERQYGYGPVTVGDVSVVCNAVPVGNGNAVLGRDAIIPRWGRQYGYGPVPVGDESVVCNAVPVENGNTVLGWDAIAPRMGPSIRLRTGSGWGRIGGLQRRGGGKR